MKQLNVCSECEFYLPIDVGTGCCRRKPPVAIGTSFFSAVYPRIEKNFAACGEFEPKTSTPNSIPKNQTNKPRRKK